MIVISSALKKQEIIDLLNGKTINNVLFKYLKTEGINMFFEVNSDDLEAVVGIVKKTIRETDFGVGLFFRVAYEGRNH